MIRYLYTLTYPEESTEPIEDRHSSPKPNASVDHIGFGQVRDDAAVPTNDLWMVASGDAEMRSDAGFLDRENHEGTAPDSLRLQSDSGIDQSAATFDISLSLLYQDLQVYVLGEKYGIPDLKKKAALHFEKVLEDADLTVKVFNIIRDVYSMTVPEDRALRDIITAKVYSEIQHWIGDTEFMEMLCGQGDFSAELLSYSTKENLKEQEGILATIQHPGYCNSCNATLVVKRWISKRRNVNVRKYCARCEPFT